MNILIGALFLSILHSILFWKQEIGVSALLFAIPVIYITIKLLKGKTKNPKALLISIPILLLSSTYFIFDNPVFQILNLIVMPILYVIMILMATSTEAQKSMVSKIISIIFEPFSYFGDLFIEIKEQILKKFNIKKEEKEEKQQRDFVKAAFFTLVVVAVVLCLLISADTEFAEFIRDILNSIGELSVPELVVRIAIAIVLFFYIASFFTNILSEYNEINSTETQENTPKESLTIHMILITLNIIYFIFCYIQIKSLFTIENIKYSSYARQGFFQLMIVSLINIIMILKATDKNLIETARQIKYKKIMCMIMLVFTLIIIISSFTRMSLYQQNYGDTRLRILVNFTLITEIILLVPTAIYITGRKINLAKSYFAIITTMYCVINFINIDNMIAKNNIDRYIETGKIDLIYITTELDSTDTIEQLVRLKDTKFKYTKSKENNENRYDVTYTEYINEVDYKIKQLNNYLSSKKIELKEEITFSEFNLSNYRARKILENIVFN